jgi:hypothetical protein
MLLAAPAAAQRDARPTTFMLVNMGPATVLAVEMSPAGQAQFSASLIGRVELPPGNALHLTPPGGSPCLNDLRIRWSDGHVEERAREDLCQPQRMIRLTTPAN